MGAKKKRRETGRSWVVISCIIIWATFTISLICWWYIFSQRQITRLSSAGGVLADELIRDQKMLMWEGAALLISLLIGAAALSYFVIRDRLQSQRLMQFFLTFTHELKTPIATLRLYAETLTENLRGEENAALGKELMRQADRLSLQLENSLALSQIPEVRLYTEELSLKDIIRPLRDEFEKLRIRLRGDAKVLGDSAAVTTIFRNVFKNASIHGKASAVEVEAYWPKEDRIEITIRDDGEGLKGDRTLLGKKFQRLYRGSGSGIGLYLSRQLAAKMGGQMVFPACSQGFTVSLELPASKLSSASGGAI